MNTITVIDGSGDTMLPELVLGYQTERQARNIVHDLIGGEIAVSLIAPRPRSGTLSLFFQGEEDAHRALMLHGQISEFMLTSTDRPTINMTYVTDGTLSLRLDDGTRNVWVVEVGYQEVEAT